MGDGEVQDTLRGPGHSHSVLVGSPKPSQS